MAPASLAQRRRPPQLAQAQVQVQVQVLALAQG
jgi:hypothetical protein